MSTKLLELHFAQVEKSLNKSQDNHYSDKSKKDYHENLNKLHSAIKEKVKGSLPVTDSEIYELKREIDFIFKSLEFLDSSTLNLIPYEIVACLQQAMNDWITPNEYIIVTSLINNIHGFSFDPIIAFDDPLYSSIQLKYKISFPQRLVQINHPKTFVRDYLASVVLYHELGHFIDLKNSITTSIADKVLQDYNTGKVTGSDKGELDRFLPFLNATVYDQPTKREMLKYHIGEYFCDLFASQYVGEASNHYLKYITENSINYSFTHPSTLHRVSVVNDFLKGSKNIILTYIQEGIYQILKKKIEIKYELPDANNFYNFLPCEIKSVRQLHGLFGMAAEVWSRDWTPFKDKMKMKNPIQRTQVYAVVNNLIEKSIGNYIILEKWKANHP